MINGTLYPISNPTDPTPDGGFRMHGFNKTEVRPKKEIWSYFPYTPSIAWAWQPQPAHLHGEDALESLNVGCLGP
jgi:hypothetical protein